MQTDPDGSQMATDNLSCPLPTIDMQASDDSWQVIVSRGRNDICIRGFKAQKNASQDAVEYRDQLKVVWGHARLL